MAPRKSGVLLHPTSLPGPFGIGDLGPEAYRFADFLRETGQSLWQVLPLGPTGFGNSPYMCFSAFAGNPLLISPEKLVDMGLLASSDLAEPPAFDRETVDYPRVQDYKRGLLAKAFARFNSGSGSPHSTRFYEFCEANAFWLDDYALFMALKQAHHWRAWPQWEHSLAQGDPEALVRSRTAMAEQVEFRQFIQYVFFTQWNELHAYCREQGLSVIGDMPIYVAYDSADVWANRDLFHLDDSGDPLAVAGVPPDYFSETGQRWGNPLYRWEAMAAQDYRWWVERFRNTFELFDITRLDHFRGFEAYWEVPPRDETTVHGTWVKGPGRPFFDTIQRSLGRAGVSFNVIAEDLGVITPEVDELRDALGFPGMRILQMAFGTDPKAPEYRPHNHTPNSVVYTATHDHNTSRGWLTAVAGTQTTQSRAEVEQERAYALDYLQTDGKEIHWDMIRAALASVADTAIFPLQDVLGLGT